MAQINHFEIGDVWQPVWTFKVGGTNTDPSVLVVKHRDPSGNVATITENTPASPAAPIVRTGPGVFRLDLPIDEAGYWYAKATGTGAVAAAESHEIIADPDPFTTPGWGISTRALVVLGETKDWLQSQNVDTGDDLDLVRVINDISDRFHRVAEREFKAIGTNPQTRTVIVPEVPSHRPWYIDGDYQGDLSAYSRWLSVGDMTTVTTVELLDNDWTTVLETVAASDMTFHRENDEPTAPITDIEFHSDVTALWPGMRVKIAGAWGFPAVPGNVRQAVLDAIVETMDRDVEHWRQDLAPASGGEAGNVIVIGRTGSRPVSLPPRALAVARDYRNRVPLG